MVVQSSSCRRLSSIFQKDEHAKKKKDCIASLLASKSTTTHRAISTHRHPTHLSYLSKKWLRTLLPTTTTHDKNRSVDDEKKNSTTTTTTKKTFFQKTKDPLSLFIFYHEVRTSSFSLVGCSWSCPWRNIPQGNVQWRCKFDVKCSGDPGGGGSDCREKIFLSCPVKEAETEDYDTRPDYHPASLVAKGPWLACGSLIWSLRVLTETYSSTLSSTTTLTTNLHLFPYLSWWTVGLVCLLSVLSVTLAFTRGRTFNECILALSLLDLSFCPRILSIHLCILSLRLKQQQNLYLHHPPNVKHTRTHMHAW